MVSNPDIPMIYRKHEKKSNSTTGETILTHTGGATKVVGPPKETPEGKISQKFGKVWKPVKK